MTRSFKIRPGWHRPLGVNHARARACLHRRVKDVLAVSDIDSWQERVLGCAEQGAPAVASSSHQAVVRDPVAERGSGPGETGHGAIQDDSMHTGPPQVTLRAEVDRICLTGDGPALASLLRCRRRGAPFRARRRSPAHDPAAAEPGHQATRNRCRRPLAAPLTRRSHAHSRGNHVGPSQMTWSQPGSRTREQRPAGARALEAVLTCVDTC
jgi:hypothetical protein